jgi:cytochrome c oxidase assembly factor CtaG
VTGHVLASGYSGPPELTAARALTSWTLDLPALLAVLALAALYLAGARRARRAGQSWPAASGAAFLAGAGLLAVATMGFPGVYQGVLFWARATQTVLLLLVVPLFLALGRPLSLLCLARPAAGRRVEAALRTPAARALTFPAITAFAVIITPFLLYFTPWYGASLRGGPVTELTHVALIVPGLVFFWTLLRVDPVPLAYSYLVSLWVAGIEVVGDAVLGLAIIADQHLITGGYYQSLGRPWGPGPRTDQVIGGGVLWILGDLVGLPFFAALLIQMIREDEREAAAVDAELDAAEAAAEKAPAEAPAASRGGAPWWETDSRFTGRFRPR